VSDASDPQQTPTRKPDPWAHRRGEPRTFAASTVGYLFACLLTTVGGASLVGGAGALLSTDVYRPAARLLMAATMAGVVIVWPLVRLSQEAPAHPRRAFAADFVLVTLPMLAMVWPQGLPWMAGWGAGACAGLSMWHVGWSLVVAGVLTWAFGAPSQALHASAIARGLGAPPGPAAERWLLMLMLIALVVVGPSIAMLRPHALHAPIAREFDALLMTSPVAGALEMVEDKAWRGRPAQLSDGHWASAAAVMGLGALAWGLAWVRSVRMERERPVATGEAMGGLHLEGEARSGLPSDDGGA
jgi:hypothetical protein